MNTPLPPFLPGLTVSRLLFESVVPVLAATWPDVPYAAGLLGPSSDVLGFDTAQSCDHAWGPRLMIFLRAADWVEAPAMDAALRLALPETIGGYPIDMAWNHSPAGLPPGGAGRNHRVTFHTVAGFFREHLGVEATRPLEPADWLVLPEQLLRSVTHGAVFHDGPGELTAARERLAYYPDDLWLYLMAGQWARIAEEEAFTGRTAQAGDELGSRLVAARLVRDIMRLRFLQERTYAPYIKWLGTAFKRLAGAARLEPLLLETLAATEWRARERPLLAALSVVAEQHNELRVTEPLPVEPRPYYDRPFQVIHAGAFADALRSRISDPQVAALPQNGGGADQWIDSTAVLSYPDRLRALRPVVGSRH
jgi:hypothetical protein